VPFFRLDELQEMARKERELASFPFSKEGNWLSFPKFLCEG